MNQRVLIADAMSQRVADVLRDHGLEVDIRTELGTRGLLTALGEYDGVIVRSKTKVTEAAMAAAPRLRVIGRAGIGVDNIDVPAATAHGVVVMNAPNGNAITTAEHTIALMMAMSRHLPQATASMRAGQWDKAAFKGREIAGKTLGLIGLGNIGRIVCDRARGLKMEVLAYDPFIQAEAAAALGATKCDLDEVLSRADYLTVHVPLIRATRHLLDAAAFARMRPGVFVINVARGGIVDEAALFDALEAGRVAGAALDVWEQEPPPADHPLRAHPRVISTPHLGASTVEAQDKVAAQIAASVGDFLTTGTIRNALNTPSITSDLLARLRPHLQLAARLGSLAAQLHPGETRSIEVQLWGLDPDARGPITNRALVDLLAHKLHRPVNVVNAAAIAVERGVEVVVADRGDHPEHGVAIAVGLVGGGKRTEVIGALFGRSEGRVVSVDGFAVDLLPSGPLLLHTSKDQPGVIGAIGTLLGGAGVGVTRCVVGRRNDDAELLAVWSTDRPVPFAVREAIRATGAGELRAADLPG